MRWTLRAQKSKADAFHAEAARKYFEGDNKKAEEQYLKVESVSSYQGALDFRVQGSGAQGSGFRV